jgi:NTP pyrophosphatase (non-canonical NTP hydrolase)
MNRNDLTPVTTMEECAEVIQAISKVFRFGPRQCHPDTGVSNLTALTVEMGQLLAMLEALSDQWQLDQDILERAYDKKLSDMGMWESYFTETKDH